jgi:anti-sigma factor RsiW
MSDTQAQIPPCRPHFTLRDLFCAWLVATAFSGLPSTAYALLIGADPLEATLAAGGMLLPMSAPPVQLFMAAAVVHCSVSAFWTAVFGALLPRHPVVVWALAGSAVVAVLDLRLIAPLIFPSVAALDFWPQFADHLMWGALLGGTLRLRQARPSR